MELASSLIRRAALLIALACGLAIPVVVIGAEPTWTPLADAPTARQEVSYVALGGQLYLAAGNDLSQQRYDPTTDKWTAVAALPADFTSIDHVQGVAVGGKIAYIGGLKSWELPFPVIDTVSLYNPATNSFTPGTDMPSPRGAGGVIAWHGKVIYAGGLGPNGAVKRVDMYDPVTNKWTQLKDMPRAREHFQLAIVGDELYAVGGRVTQESAGKIVIDDISAVDVLELPADDADLPNAAW